MTPFNMTSGSPRRWASTARVSTRSSKTRDFYIGRIEWVSSCPAKWRMLICLTIIMSIVLRASGRQALAPGYRYNGTPIYLSEFGGIAFIPPGHQVPAEAWGYSGVEKGAADALARLRGIYEAMARLSLVGFCYTQLTDVEQEINGLLTYDRKPKFDVKTIREINSLVH